MSATNRNGPTDSVPATSNPFFRPWKGQNYEHGVNGKRLLLLGESHYGAGANTPDMTNLYIKGYLASPRNIRFFDGIERLVTGGPLQFSQREQFWQSVAFCNFLQEALPDNKAPKPARLWLAARDPFVHVLHEFKPERLLILGTATWNSLSEGHGLFDSVPVLPEQFAGLCQQGNASRPHGPTTRAIENSNTLRGCRVLGGYSRDRNRDFCSRLSLRF